MIDGIKVKIGGERYVLPPLGLAGLKKWLDLQKAFSDASAAERFELNLEVVHAALVRNYPDLTLDEVKEKIHAGEAVELAGTLTKILELSGMKPAKAEGGAKKKRGSTGTKSTGE